MRLGFGGTWLEGEAPAAAERLPRVAELRQLEGGSSDSGTGTGGWTGAAPAAQRTASSARKSLAMRLGLGGRWLDGEATATSLRLDGAAGAAGQPSASSSFRGAPERMASGRQQQQPNAAAAGGAAKHEMAFLRRKSLAFRLGFGSTAPGMDAAHRGSGSAGHVAVGQQWQRPGSADGGTGKGPDRGSPASSGGFPTSVDPQGLTCEDNSGGRRTPVARGFTFGGRRARRPSPAAAAPPPAPDEAHAEEEARPGDGSAASAALLLLAAADAGYGSDEEDVDDTLLPLTAGAAMAASQLAAFMPDIPPPQVASQRSTEVSAAGRKAGARFGAFSGMHRGGCAPNRGGVTAASHVHCYGGARPCIWISIILAPYEHAQTCHTHPYTGEHAPEHVTVSRHN